MTKTTAAASVVVCVILMAGATEVWGGPGIISNLKQVAPMRQDSLKVPAIRDMEKDAPSSTVATSTSESIESSTGVGQTPPPSPLGGYDPSGRRDPFVPVLSQLAPGQIDPTLPPLQRVGLTDMNLIAVIWGAYGYTAMVQMPDGNGYTVRKGTRIGPNNGVVSAISDKGIIVQERFTDVYGRKQEREYVKLLHSKEGLE
ncbi:pilus assembly protein PilP [Petrachloros mirabilis]